MDRSFTVMRVTGGGRGEQLVVGGSGVGSGVGTGVGAGVGVVALPPPQESAKMAAARANVVAPGGRSRIVILNTASLTLSVFVVKNRTSKPAPTKRRVGSTGVAASRRESS